MDLAACGLPLVAIDPGSVFGPWMSALMKAGYSANVARTGTMAFWAVSMSAI